LRSIIEACVRFRLLVVALAAGITVIGILRLASMPVDALPDTSQPASATSDVMVIGLTSTRVSVPDLSVLASRTIVPRLLGQPGVAGVSAFGEAGQGGRPLTAGAQVRGVPGLVLVVRKAPSANVLTVSSEVDQALAAVAPRLPGVTVDPALFREDAYLRSAQANLQVALVACGVLAALALITLLLRLRVAFAALFATALSLITATALLDVLGYSFNAIVTLGLLLALVLVVTEAAGEAQAIVSRLDAADPPAPERGAGRATARLVAAACADTRGALTGAGLAALLCIVPLLLATGRTAAFLRPMAVAFALAVAASLVVAVCVTPALVAVLLTVVPGQAHGTPLPRQLGPGYARALSALVRAPRLAIGCLALLAVAGVAGLVLLPGLHPGQPTFTDRALMVRMTAPRGTSLTVLDRRTALASDELLAVPAVQDVAAMIGRGVSGGHVTGTDTGRLWVTIRPDFGYGQAVAAVSTIAAGTPGLTGTVSTHESDSMAGVLSGSRTTVLPPAIAGFPRVAFAAYAIAALIGVLLIAQATTRNWRLTALAFGSLPVSLAGAVFVVTGLGAAGSLAAAAGLLSVFALAVRQAIAFTRRDDLAIILTPAVVTAVAVAPFAVATAEPGMELLRTAAMVILGGLVTTTLVSLFGLPVACRFLGPRPVPDSATAVSAPNAA